MKAFTRTLRKTVISRGRRLLCFVMILCFLSGCVAAPGGTDDSSSKNAGSSQATAESSKNSSGKAETSGKTEVSGKTESAASVVESAAESVTSESAAESAAESVAESTALEASQPEPPADKGLTVSADNLSVTDETGVSLDLSCLLFDYDEELEVKIEPAGVETAENGDWQITAYNIEIGDLKELDTWIDIRIPYEGTFCAKGEDPAECVGAKYLNKETGEWEDVLFDVDAAAKEVIIHTDHLSTYGCFEVSNAGLRSAYITRVDSFDVNLAAEGIDLDKCTAALTEYAAIGASSEKCYKLGELALTDVFQEISNAVSKVNDAGTALQLSDLFFFTEKYASFNEGFWKKMGNVGLACGALNLGLEIMKSDKTPADILTIYKDAGLYTLGIVGDTAMGISLVGISLIDRTINDFGKAAQGYVVERVNNVYLYYNEKFPGGVDYGTSHVARTSRQWRDIVAQAVQSSGGDEAKFKEILENEIDTYARKFWNEPDSVAWQLQTDFAEHFSGGRLGTVTKDQKDELIASYKQRMYQRLSGAILKEMEKDYQHRVQARLLKNMNDVKAELNSEVTFQISESMEGKEKATMPGYQIRFSKLSNLASTKEAIKTWTTTLGKDGTVSLKATVIGYILAGLPDHVDVYEPKADLNKDKPVLSVKFSFAYPKTSITLKAEEFPTLEEIAGYYENGVATLTDIGPKEVIEAMKAAAAKEAEGDEEGCDIDLEALIGQSAELPFTIEQTGENTAIIITDSSDEEDDDEVNLSNQELVYDQTTGVLKFETPLVSEEGTVQLSFQCTYTDDTKTAVALNGMLREDMNMEGAQGLYVVGKLKAEKPIEAAE